MAAYSLLADDSAARDLLVHVASLPHTPSVTLETIAVLLMEHYEHVMWATPDPNGKLGGSLKSDGTFYKVSSAIAKHSNATPAVLSELAAFLKRPDWDFLSLDPSSETNRQDALAFLTAAKERLEAAQQQSAKSSRVLSF